MMQLFAAGWAPKTRNDTDSSVDCACYQAENAMMRFVIVLFTALAVLSVSAHAEDEMRFTKGKGDPRQYIIQQALKCGANKISTNDLPPLKGDWKYSEDQYGVVLQLGRDQFDEVQSFLKRAFGPPAHEASESTDGGKLGWYSAKRIGIGLQFGYDKKRTQVIVLRPQKSSEIYSRAETLAKTNSKKEHFGKLAREAKKREEDEPRVRQIAIKAAVERGFSGELDAVATRVRLGWLVGVFRKSEGAINGNIGTASVDDDFHLVDFESSAQPSK